MSLFDPRKEKYHRFYWDVAIAASKRSVANRLKVGAVVVTPTGIISTGWNGMPAGLPNSCEDTLIECPHQGVRYKTNQEVIHAEQNALDKMLKQGLSTVDSYLFVTTAPCLECAKRISGLGLSKVMYLHDHDDMRGVALLKRLGIPITKV